jgi:hypothetical protein
MFFALRISWWPDESINQTNPLARRAELREEFSSRENKPQEENSSKELSLRRELL